MSILKKWRLRLSLPRKFVAALDDRMKNREQKRVFSQQELDDVVNLELNRRDATRERRIASEVRGIFKSLGVEKPSKKEMLLAKAFLLSRELL
jgi:hypothetical protein